MKVLYIWDADYPWDVRVEKICMSLAAAGHEVHIAARNLRKSAPYERIAGLHIHRLKPWAIDGLNYALSFPLFFSPIWLKRLHGVIRAHDIDLIIVRDLPLAIAGIWSGRLNRIPVIFDMAEDYVAMVRVIWDYSKFEKLNLVLRNPYAAKLVERYALRRVDRTLVVVEEMVQVVANGGGDESNATIVGNTPPLASFQQSGPGEVDLSQIRQRYSAIYTGGLEMARGIQLMFDAIPSIVKEIPDFLFVIVGEGKTRAALAAIASEKGVQDHVFWAGWVDHDQIFEYIRSCDVGIIPHFVTPHVATTIPNKLFDYMGCGIPVIASDAPPMQRVLDEERAGVTFNNGDADDLARAVLQVRESTVDFGGNGMAAVRAKYNWSHDEKRLLDAVQQVKRG
ncbi:MAG: glycosyltransferase family 4 protein [Gemmatimonadota bacterium]|nr:MAG: glycosyltransferase family 4 protein [Gemmatimonadota bacterium]